VGITERRSAQDFWVRAFRLSTAEQIWESALGEAVGGVLIVGDRVFVGGFNGTLYVLDASNGQLLSRSPLFGPPNRMDRLGTNLVVGFRMSPGAMGVDGKTGRALWRTVAAVEPNLSGLLSAWNVDPFGLESNIAVSPEETQFLLQTDLLLTLVDARDGRRLWQHRMPAQEMGGWDRPWLHAIRWTDHQLFLCLYDQILALDRATGKISWVHTLTVFGKPESAMAVLGDSVVTSDFRHDHPELASRWREGGLFGRSLDRPYPSAITVWLVLLLSSMIFRTTRRLFTVPLAAAIIVEWCRGNQVIALPLAAIMWGALLRAWARRLQRLRRHPAKP
jgi:hypothetical protein